MGSLGMPGLFTQDDQQDPEIREMLRRLGLLPAGGGPMSLPNPSPQNPIQALRNKAPTSPPAQQAMGAPQMRPPAQIQAPQASPGVGDITGYQTPTPDPRRSEQEILRQWEALIGAKTDREAVKLATKLATTPPTMGTARKEYKDLWKSKGKIGKVGLVLREALGGLGKQGAYVRPADRAFARQMETWKEQGKQAAGAARIAGLTERAAQQQARQWLSDREKTAAAAEKQKMTASLEQADTRIKGLQLEQKTNELKYKVAKDNRTALARYDEALVNQTPKNIEQSLIRDAWNKYPQPDQDVDRQAYINIGREKQIDVQERLRQKYRPTTGTGIPKGRKLSNVSTTSVFDPASGHLSRVESGIDQIFDPQTNRFHLRRIFGDDVPEGVIPLSAADAVTASAFEGSLSQIHLSVGAIGNSMVERAHGRPEAALQTYGLTSHSFFTRLRQLFGEQNRTLGAIVPETALLSVAAPNQVWLHARALTKYRPSIEMVKELTKAINASAGTVEAKMNAVLGLKIATELALYSYIGLINLDVRNESESVALISKAMTDYIKNLQRGVSVEAPDILEIFNIDVPGQKAKTSRTVGTPVRDPEDEARIGAALAGTTR